MDFQRNDKRATVSRKDETYYVLRMGDLEIGGTNRSALERYARKNGFTPDYRDDRPKGMEISHGL